MLAVGIWKKTLSISVLYPRYADKPGGRKTVVMHPRVYVRQSKANDREYGWAMIPRAGSTPVSTLFFTFDANIIKILNLMT